MKNRFRNGVVMLMMAALPGCVVSQSTHEQTLQDLQVTKSNLDQTRVQNEALNKQVKVLKELNAKLQGDVERANSETASLNAAMGKERQGMESKLKDLERQVKDLTKAKKDLAQELEVQQQRSENYLKTIRRQQKELREREQAALLLPPAPTKSAASAAQKPPDAPALPIPAPGAASPMGPKDGAASPAQASLVDINKASVADLIVILDLGKEDSDKLLKNRPYKSKDELVSKAGIAKATADRIKDKITVGP